MGSLFKMIEKGGNKPNGTNAVGTSSSIMSNHKVRGLDHSKNIPKEYDIFQNTMASFLPPGKTFDDLTHKEKKDLQQRYRFDPYKPGIYQTLTGFGAMR